MWGNQEYISIESGDNEEVGILLLYNIPGDLGCQDMGVFSTIFVIPE